MSDNLASARVDMLKARAKRCCCKYCGGDLRVKRLIFSDYEPARVELYCENCDRIEFGVEPEIYQSACYFIDELEFDAYPNLDANDTTRRMNIAKVCEIMAWENKQLGILDENGFNIALNFDQNMLGECIILDDEDLR